MLLVGGSPYFSVVFAVLEHSVLEREYAPMFQADFCIAAIERRLWAELIRTPDINFTFI